MKNNTRVISAFSLLLMIVFAVFLFPSRSQSQQLEVGLITGTTSYIGEIESDYGNKQSILQEPSNQVKQYAVGAFARRSIGNGFDIRTNIIYGQVAASDKNSSDYARTLRNLHFRTHILEVSVQTEFTLLATNIFSKKHSKGSAKSIGSGLSTLKKNSAAGTFRVYSFVGAGIFNFNPQAKLGNVWYDLQALGTEGQGISNSEYQLPMTKKYNLTEVTVPMGMGVSISLSQDIKLGFELGVRKTFTDYIDDISTNYVDQGVIAAEHGIVAAKLSNRTAEVTNDAIEQSYFSKGMKRGNPETNDLYIFSVLTLSKSF